MANEITLRTMLSVLNGNLKSKLEPGDIRINQTTKRLHAPVVSVGTSEEDLSFGDLVTPGLVMLRNLDAANFVTYGPKSGGSMVAFGKIKAGETAIVRLSGSVTWRWVADTGACLVQVFALDD